MSPWAHGLAPWARYTLGLLYEGVVTVIPWCGPVIPWGGIQEPQTDRSSGPGVDGPSTI